MRISQISSAEEGLDILVYCWLVRHYDIFTGGSSDPLRGVVYYCLFIKYDSPADEGLNVVQARLCFISCVEFTMSASTTRYMKTSCELNLRAFHQFSQSVVVHP